MEIQNRIAVVTGGGGGIGQATGLALARLGAGTVGLVDRSDAVKQAADQLNAQMGHQAARAFVGDVTDAAFRRQTYDDLSSGGEPVTICVPAAGITRDALSVKVDKLSGRASLYPEELFRMVTDVNLIAPVYWALEMVARIAEDRVRRGLGRWEPREDIRGTVVFIGSVSSQGNKGQISYASTKAGLEGAAATLMKEGMFHGVRSTVIHPGFTDTPMVRSMGDDYIARNILPFTQLGRLIRPEEIANGICFLISNSAISGELWADAGWHPSR